MTSRHFKLAEEDVSVAKVTVGPPLSRLISKLFSDEQPLPNRTDSRVHIKVRINSKHFEAITANTASTGSDKMKMYVDKNLYIFLTNVSNVVLLLLVYQRP